MAVYEFANGLKIRREDLMDLQVQRYTSPGNPNLHEPVEESWLLRSFGDDTPTQPVFLDIGAAVGYYAILVKQRWPQARVVAVDALARHLRALAENARLNGLRDGDIEVLQVAVAQAEGHTEFADMGYGSSLAEEMPEAWRAKVAVIRVRTRPLAALLEELPPVHLMKMDIQGSEVGVLKAARGALAAGRVRYALVGTHGSQRHEGVRDLLRKCGFTILLDDPEPDMQPDGIVLGRHG